MKNDEYLANFEAYAKKYNVVASKKVRKMLLSENEEREKED